MIAILLLELTAAHALRESPENLAPFLEPIASWTGEFASVVHNFDAFGVNALALNLYFGATLWLLVPKAMFWYWWLHSNRWANARYLVITPLTGDVAGGLKEFAVAGSVELPPGKRRSMASRLFWSFLEVALAAGFVWGLLRWGNPTGAGDPTQTHLGFGAEVSEVLQMGFTLWLPWSLLFIGMSSLFVAIAATVVRDSAIAILRALPAGAAKRQDRSDTPSGQASKGQE